ncbi:MAG: hypothetical protein PF638_09670 [Candidatus Delongbacteria bacterium]|jgi:protein-arginine kinase|nr:hypothetical protein [Candidatus Delongbacteria bacterium]
MNISENYVPFWMKGNDNSIAIYSSVKCVRNFNSIIFPANKKQFNPSSIIKLVDDILSESLLDETIVKINLQQLSISELAMIQKVRILPNIRISELKKLTLYTYKTGKVFLLLNYKDHLTFYSNAQGASIKKAYNPLRKFIGLFDDKSFAKDNNNRYLTSSIEYYGTGIKCFSVLTLPSLRQKNKLPEIVSSLSQNGYSYKKYFGFGSNLDDLIIIMNKDSLTVSEKDIVNNLDKFLKLLHEEVIKYPFSNSELNSLHQKMDRLLKTEFLTFKSFMEAYYIITLLIENKKLEKIRISELNKTLSILIINLPKVVHTARVTKKSLKKLIKKLNL